MRCYHLYLVAIVTLLFASVVAAPADDGASKPLSKEACLNIELVKQLDAHGGYVRIAGDSLFLTSDVGKGEQTGYWFDLTLNLLEPKLVSDRLPGAWDVAVNADYAMLCDYKKYFSVYCTRNNSWELSAKLDMPSMTENVILRDNLAFIANHTAGLSIVDVADPGKPAIVGRLNPKIDCDAIGLCGDTAILYGHWESQLVLVDISNPKQPKGIGVYQNAPKTFNQGELAIDEGIAYCTALTGLVVVDVRDPNRPKLLKDMKLEGPITDVEVCGDYAFIAAGMRGVIVLDVRDPANPVRAGCYASGAKLAASQVAENRRSETMVLPAVTLSTWRIEKVRRWF